MFFRPYPGVTIATALLSAFLVWLGVWQLQRLEWKEALIARVASHMTQPTLSLDEALRMDVDTVQYRKVALTGHFNTSKEVFVFTMRPGGGPVYHLLTPFLTEDGRTLMVDRGEIPGDMRTLGRVPPVGPQQVVGVWRVPDAPNFFTGKPDLQRRVWYARDLKSIAAWAGVTLAAPVVIEADATPNPGGWPLGGQTVVSFTNNHLSYAVTWFGLAAGLIGVYLAFHISKGRLGRRP